jgi:hypothetical protein
MFGEHVTTLYFDGFADSVGHGGVKLYLKSSLRLPTRHQWLSMERSGIGAPTCSIFSGLQASAHDWELTAKKNTTTRGRSTST